MARSRPPRGGDPGLGTERSSKMRRILVPLDGTGAAEAAVKEIEAICEPGDEVVLSSSRSQAQCLPSGRARMGHRDVSAGPNRVSLFTAAKGLARARATRGTGLADQLFRGGVGQGQKLAETPMQAEWPRPII